MVTTRSASRNSPSTPLSARSSPAGHSLEIDPVAKARTINHMNKDHADDMVAILRHYAGLTEAQAVGATMEDLDLAQMTIRSPNTSPSLHTIPIVPPMSDWADRRARLVEITIAARSALHPVQFYPPEGLGILSFVGVMWYFLSVAMLYSGNLEQGSPFWRLIEAIRFPKGPELYVRLVGWILIPMLVVHFAEAAYMAKTRLAPKSVAAGSSMWWKWVVCAFLEGAPCWKKWDRRVLGKQKTA